MSDEVYTKDKPFTLPDGTLIASESLLCLKDHATGTIHLAQQADLFVKRPDKQWITVRPKDQATVYLDTDLRLHIDTDVVWEPPLSRIQGENLAYFSGGTEKEQAILNFEHLAYRIFLTTRPPTGLLNEDRSLNLDVIKDPNGVKSEEGFPVCLDGLVSSDTVRIAEERLGWPQYDGNRSWAGPAMARVAKAYGKHVIRAQSVYHSKKSKQPIGQYVSLVYDPSQSMDLENQITR